MQDRYVGDIGDFGKYALLRALIGHYTKSEPLLSLGIVWYKTNHLEISSESQQEDGKYIGYLDKSNSEFQLLDPKLFKTLKTIVNGDRTIAAVQKSTVFPQKDTIYFTKSLTSKNGQKVNREKWFSEALATTTDCDIVFVDPDNGLLPDSTREHDSKAVKCVLPKELREFATRKGQALVVYHQLGRRGTHEIQIKNKLKFLKETLPNYSTIYALRYRRGTSRAYFIAIPQTQKIILARVERFLATWKKHFEKIEI